MNIRGIRSDAALSDAVLSDAPDLMRPDPMWPDPMRRERFAAAGISRHGGGEAVHAASRHHLTTLRWPACLPAHLARWPCWPRESWSTTSSTSTSSLIELAHLPRTSRELTEVRGSVRWAGAEGSRPPYLIQAIQCPRRMLFFDASPRFKVGKLFLPKRVSQN